MKTVIVTGPEKNIFFTKSLEKLGFVLVFYPTISIQKKELTEEELTLLKNIKLFDWVVFTSKNGVRFCMEQLKILDISVQIKKTAVVGPQTAKELEKYSLKPDFIPSVFNAKHLAEELPVMKGQKILFPRAEEISPDLVKKIKQRGGEIFELVVYRTQMQKNKNEEFEKLVMKNQIAGIVFMSPSSVKGFMYGLGSKEIKKNTLECAVFSIGPSTSKALRQLGFHNIHTASPHTIEGIVKKMRSVI